MSHSACARIVAVLSVVTVGLSGCLTLAAYQMGKDRRDFDRLSVFEPAEHLWVQGEGSTVLGQIHVVAGRVDYRRGGGIEPVGGIETLTCRDRRVRLLPDTEHMRWQAEFAFRLRARDDGYWRSGFASADADWAWPAQSAPFVKEARCDTDGRFILNDVPDGPYLLMAEIEPPAYTRDTVEADLVLKPVRIVGGGELDVRIGSDSLLSISGLAQRNR